MKLITVFIFFVFLSLSACKSARESQVVGQAGPAPLSLSSGRVSHQYRATGCLTVILVDKPGEAHVLIPREQLASKYDKDGLELNFNYHLLKMPNPKGCEVGIPAELSNISIK